MHATTKPLSASSPAPPAKWALRLLTDLKRRSAAKSCCSSWLHPTGTNEIIDRFQPRLRRIGERRLLACWFRLSAETDFISLELRLHGAGYRRPITGNQVSRAHFETNSSLEALLERHIPKAAFDVESRLVVAVLKRCCDEGRILIKDIIHSHSDGGAIKPRSPSTWVVLR